jgi:hypothetical protein
MCVGDHTVHPVPCAGSSSLLIPNSPDVPRQASLSEGGDVSVQLCMAPAVQGPTILVLSGMDTSWMGEESK